MTASIFAVVSPLQYLNALEAIHAFRLRPDECYLAVGRSRKLPATTAQLAEILDPGLWRSIETVEGFPAEAASTRLGSEWRNLLGARRYARAADRLIARARREHPTISHLFLGDYRPMNFRHFVGALPEAEIWLLDDGSVTHQVLRRRKDPSSPHLFAGQFPRLTPAGWLRGKLSGLRYAEPDRLGFFTCYEFEGPARDTVRRHSYEAYRERYGPLESVEEVWFLGSNHSENGFTVEERYLQLVRSVASCYREHRVVYLPHRGESEAKLALIRALGFVVRRLELPIEVVVGRSGIFPKVIVGIASSAIDNLSVLLGSRIQVHLVRIAEDYTTGAQAKHLRDVIDYHERDVHSNTRAFHELDQASFSRDGADTRFFPAPATAGAGYFEGVDGWLRGAGVGVVRLDAARRGGRLTLPNLTPPRMFRAGERVVLEGTHGGQRLDGVIVDSSPSSEVTLRFDVPVPAGEETSWLVVRSEARLASVEGGGRLDGVLLEPEATNWLRGANDLSSPAWELAGFERYGAGRPSSVAWMFAPNHSNEAVLFLTNPDASRSQLSQSVTSPSPGAYALSIYARPGGIDALLLRVRDSSEAECGGARFEWRPPTRGYGLDTVVESRLVPGATARFASVGPVRHGWVRCVLVVETKSSEVRAEVEVARRPGAPREGESGVYLWGAQLESGKVATSFVPTWSRPRRREAGSLELGADGPAGGTRRSFVEFVDAPSPVETNVLRWAGGGALSLDRGNGRWVLTDKSGAERFESFAAERSVRLEVLEEAGTFTILQRGRALFEEVRSFGGAISIRGGPLFVSAYTRP